MTEILMAVLAAGMVILAVWYFGNPPSAGGGNDGRQAANVAEGSNAGAVTRLADAAVATRYLLGKIGSAEGRVAVAGAADIPIGVIADEAAAAGDPVAVELFGCAGRTLRGKAAATVTAGAYLVPAANGEVTPLPATTGTYYIVGRALHGAAAGGAVLFDPCVPVQRVVA